MRVFAFLIAVSSSLVAGAPASFGAGLEPPLSVTDDAYVEKGKSAIVINDSNLIVKMGPPSTPPVPRQPARHELLF